MKKLLKTKTFWLGVVTTVLGIVQIAQGNTDSGSTTIALGLGMITGRQALTKAGA